ncbi:MAG: sulfide/dihydroorotate dehydrogenase-like FAD/NAD-binding protein [Candidatus Thermoplasmatota archaeon]|nr:sulfide/dihydroorotate dehydrogenase-like FAD/NAD-binding protein [Candidatus Thermoplasmatota archaeon]
MKYEITRKEDFNSEDYLLEVRAPLVSERFRAGNFVVLLTHPKGERIPMSVLKAENDKISLIIKKLGKTSYELDTYEVGDSLEAVIGPLGNPIVVKEYGNVAVASDLVCGHAENYAASKALHEIDGNHVISIQTFPTKDLKYLEEELKSVSDEYHMTTTDGSYGTKGHYLDVLVQLLKEKKVDMIFAGGKISSLKELSDLIKPYGIPAMVTLRSIMVDGTGMCGSCRVYINGEMKLACIDGPMFEASMVDFDALLNATARFKEVETEAMKNYNKEAGGK